MITVKNKYYLLLTGLLSILFIIFYTWLLPLYDVSVISKGFYSLDIRSSYTKNVVIQLFNFIGELGIIQYKKFLIVDFAYILVYGSLAYYLLQFLLNNMGRLGDKLKLTKWFPLILMMLDIIENMNTFFLLKNSFDIADSAVQLGSTVTTLKWFAASVLFGMIICYTFYTILRNVLWKLRKNESTLSK